MIWFFKHWKEFYRNILSLDVSVETLKTVFKKFIYLQAYTLTTRRLKTNQNPHSIVSYYCPLSVRGTLPLRSLCCKYPAPCSKKVRPVKSYQWIRTTDCNSVGWFYFFNWYYCMALIIKNIGIFILGFKLTRGLLKHIYKPINRLILKANWWGQRGQGS